MPFLLPTQPSLAAAHAGERRETNMMRWNCHIPGKDGTLWEGGFYPLSIEFTEDYPAKPPKVPAASRPQGGLPLQAVVPVRVWASSRCRGHLQVPAPNTGRGRAAGLPPLWPEFQTAPVCQGAPVVKPHPCTHTPCSANCLPGSFTPTSTPLAPSACPS